MTDRFADSARRAAHLASGSLGWTPAYFWAATPAELRTALGADGESVPGLDRPALQRLMEVFPDG